MLKSRSIGVLAVALFVLAMVLSLVAPAVAAVYKDISEFRHVRYTNSGGASDWTVSADITKAELQAKNYFKVDTREGAVDLDFGNDAALDAADIGSTWRFCVGWGGSNALTVTVGASGVTTMKVVDADGTTCEDVGDCVEVTAYATTAATAFMKCAD